MRVQKPCGMESRWKNMEDPCNILCQGGGIVPLTSIGCVLRFSLTIRWSKTPSNYTSSIAQYCKRNVNSPTCTNNCDSVTKIIKDLQKKNTNFVLLNFTL